MSVASSRIVPFRIVSVVPILVWSAALRAQDGPNPGTAGQTPRQDAPPRSAQDEPAPDIDYDSEPPYDIYERHWRRQSRDYSRSRWGRYRGGWYRSPYSPGWSTYRSYRGDPYDYELGDPYFDDGYEAGWRDGRRYAEWEQRDELGRAAYADAMGQGLDAFRHGDYSTAVRHFVRAAKLNQGDPASRIHAAHAMTAIGRYAEALPALRRAFQLQSKIAYLALDIPRDYGRPGDFEAHLSALRQAAQSAPDDPRLWLLLGYYQFFSGREADALVSLKKSAELSPDDFMTEALLDAAGMSAPAPPQTGGPTKSEPFRARSEESSQGV